MEIASVSATAPEAHTVRFIQFSRIRTIISFQKGILHAFHRKIQSPVLSIDRDIDITAQRTVHSKIRHHLIHQIILHHRIILYQIIQAQLIQSVVTLTAVILVKFQLKAVPFTVHLLYLTERCISFRTDSYIFVLFTVNHHGAAAVFLVFTGFKKGIPVVHDNINAMYL